MSSIRNISAQDINRAIRLLDQGDTAQVSTDRLQSPAIKQISKLTTSGTLDRADLFALLAGLQRTDSKISQTNLRRTLGLPRTDPEGVTLKFETIALPGNSNVAIVRIVPNGIQPEKKSDVFVGGLYHLAGAYARGAIRFALAEQRELILVDCPGVGGSALPKSSSVTYDHLTKHTANALMKASGGKIRWLMGHSLGTVVVRHMYFADKNKPTPRAERFIPIAMMPASQEARAGLVMKRHFSQWHAVASLTLRGGIMKPSSLFVDTFFGSHPEEKNKQWLQRLVSKESFPITMPSFLNIRSKVSNRSLLPYIGKDPKLTIVMHSGDKLMQATNAQQWQGRGIVRLHGDHSATAGKSYAAVAAWTELRAQLNQKPNTTQPTININRMMQHSRINTGVALRGSTADIFSGGLFVDYNYGLGTHFDLRAGARALFNGKAVNIEAEAGISVAPFTTSRLRFDTHIQTGLNALTGNQHPLAASAGAAFDIVNVAELAVRFKIDTDKNKTTELYLKWGF